MTTAITHDTAQVTTAQERLAAEARRLYDAETALHIAHQTRIDQWIAAAGDRLHEAIVAYRAALEAAGTEVANDTDPAGSQPTSWPM